MQNLTGILAWSKTASPPARVIGYAVTYPGASTLKPENVNTYSTPQQSQIGMVVLPTPVASKRVLVAGVVVSWPWQNQTDSTSRASYNYSNIIGDGANDNDIGEPLLGSSHLRGKMPIGDNLGMLDGSACWRKFQDMIPRTLPTAATFWW
jgi:hypothetical protein